ncbi:hypothetical protein Cgig2_020271 [Carnegiea gigantea]|uniref:DUF4110 domain-containing protein n=1 Tax=Carnegiea gigantea TaxID=171969 RepID=A0A9Q1KVU0_9CARY|nr:hypothetical protein Cgig2_020271 [Carnegiea gigantea]
MGKKQKKPGKGKEKTERKTAKAEEKRTRRESKKLSPEDDIDAILLSIQKEEAKKKEVHVEDNVPAPSPRSNCSLLMNYSTTELLFYVGVVDYKSSERDRTYTLWWRILQWQQGKATYVYGDLYRCDVEKQEWKLVSSPNSPPPRSAHQAVAWKNYLYIFGTEKSFHMYNSLSYIEICGEFTSPNQERFHHYKDFWVLDLKTNQWEQLNFKGAPSPRSGHRMVLYKHKIIVFGGFYDTLREVRYLNDLHVFDLDQFKFSSFLLRSGQGVAGHPLSQFLSVDGCFELQWQEIKPRPGCMWPSPRSGFQFVVYQDEIFLYGGYFKEVSSDKNSSSEKGIVHSDMWSLDPRTWEWNKVKKSGMPPGPRAGFSMCLHKKRVVLFGGVVDMEVEGDVMMSLFLDELYGFQLDNHRWYPLELRKEKSSKAKLKKISDQKNNELTSSDMDISEPNSSDAIMNDQEVEAELEESIGEMSLGTDGNANGGKLGSNTGGKSREPETNGGSRDALPQVVKPCGRINACMAVGRDTLYLYGGMMEIKDREITLDDLYMLNLSKLDEWKCIIPVSNGDGKSLQVGDAVALIKGEGKSVRRKEKRARVEQIRASLGLSDSMRTPMPGESLRDFYRRTSMYWQMAAHEHTQHTGKELRKDGFDLAEARYRELKPLLDELAKLEEEQKAEEQEAAESSSRRGANKKNRQLALQR